MKKLLIALLLISTSVSAKDDPIKMCADFSKAAHNIAVMRDLNKPLIEVLEMSDSKLIRKIVRDAYKRSYLTPVKLGNKWALKCFDFYDKKGSVKK